MFSRNALLFFLLFFLCKVAQATIYCVDPDAIGGTGCSSIVQTIEEVNEIPLLAGDNILFKRGHRWTGEKLVISASGTAGNEIVFGAYGEGAAPIIEGFTDTSILPLRWEKATQLSALYQAGVQIWRLVSDDPDWMPQNFVNWVAVLETTVNGEPVLRRLRSRDRACHDDETYQELFDQNYDYSYSSRCPDNGNWNFWVRLDEGSPVIDGRKVYMAAAQSGPLIDTNEQQYIVIQDLDIRGSAGTHAMPAILLRNSENLIIQNNEISFSKMAMSTREVLNDDTLGLVGLYRLDGRIGSSETKVSDSSGSGNSGVAIGGTEWVEGQNGQPALKFDGLDDYVSFNITNEAAFDPQNAITVMGWFFHDSTGGDGTVGIQKHQSYHLAAIETDRADSRYQFRIVDPDGVIHNIYTSFLPNDTWHHVAGSYDGTEIKIYVDGVQAATPIAWSGGIANSANPFELGRRSTFRYFKGVIDDVYVSNRALTDDEIYRISKTPNYFSNSEIRGNIIHDNLDGGIELAGLSSFNTIINNDVFGNWDLGENIGDRVGIELTQYQSYYASSRKTGNIIESNRVYGNGTEGITGDAVIAIFGGKNTEVRYNQILDNGQPAFYFAWAEDSTFYYNLISGNRTVNGRHLALIGNINLRLYNNTIVGNTLNATSPSNPYGSWRLISIDGPTSSGGEIKNNIIAYNRMYSDMPENPTALMMVWPTTAAIDNNLYFNNQSWIGAEPQSLWFTSPSPNSWYTDFNDWKSRTSYDQMGFESDPVFNNLLIGDFSLTSNSPAIETGTDLGFTSDIINNLIVGVPDIGAFENQDPDNDDFDAVDDCNSQDSSVYPGAIEISLDGIDQNCNEGDATIQVIKATYSVNQKGAGTLEVEATVAGGQSDQLTIENYGPMEWANKQGGKWILKLRNVAINPVTIHVTGSEGTIEANVAGG